MRVVRPTHAQIKPVVREQAFQVATLRMELFVLPAALQQSRGRGWALAHLDGAKSWRNGKVKTVLGSGTLVAMCDQCCFGLVSNVDCVPMQKRTMLMTNIEPLHEAFDKMFCDCGHDRQVIQGSNVG